MAAVVGRVAHAAAAAPAAPPAPASSLLHELQAAPRPGGGGGGSKHMAGELGWSRLLASRGGTGRLASPLGIPERPLVRHGSGRVSSTRCGGKSAKAVLGNGTQCRQSKDLQQSIEKNINDSETSGKMESMTI